METTHWRVTVNMGCLSCVFRRVSSKYQSRAAPLSSLNDNRLSSCFYIPRSCRTNGTLYAGSTQTLDGGYSLLPTSHPFRCFRLTLLAAVGRHDWMVSDTPLGNLPVIRSAQREILSSFLSISSMSKRFSLHASAMVM
jgi:hypothetical protein